MTPKPIHLLLVEHSDDDVLCVSTLLDSHGDDMEGKRVTTANEFRKALGLGGNENIVCDLTMPSFNLLSAVEILQESEKRIVSGVSFDSKVGLRKERVIRNDGTVSHVLDRGREIRDISGKVTRMDDGKMEQTEKKAQEQELTRSRRAMRMLSSCNEILIRASDEDKLLHEVCRIAVEIGGYRIAWIGYSAEEDPQGIVRVAHAGDEPDIPERDGFWCADDNPFSCALSDVHSAGHSDIRICPDASGNPESARKCRFPDNVRIPLSIGGRVLGVLSVHGAKTDHVEASEIEVLHEIANHLSLGIETIRSRNAHKRADAVISKVAQTVSGGSGSEFFQTLAGNMVEALGASVALIGKLNPADHCIETISYMEDGKTMGNLSYGLEGAPCEGVAAGSISVIERNVQSLFPDNELLSRWDIESYAGIPMFKQDGGVVGVMAVFFTSPLHDAELVTSTLRIFAARASSELERQESDARIHEQASLLDKARDAILVHDLNHKIIYWNKSAVRLYGWSAEEAIGSSVDDLLYLEKSGFFNAYEQTLRTGDWAGELTQVDKSGREIIIEGRWSLVRDDEGKPQKILSINTDITGYRRLEIQYNRAQRLESIGILAGGIAHDINNILTPICIAVETLQMNEPGQRELELLDTIACSAKRGADMVGRVLWFARGEESCHVYFHPRRIILEIESILRDTFPTNIELATSADRDLWIIDGDPTQIHQVVLNLCVNACDAISGAGRISISAENVHLDASFAAVNLEAEEGPHVCIRVRDSGEGIAADVIDKIFDPFFTTKAIGKGSGLGLPASLAIVKRHGGFIRISSRPGEETDARIYIPAHPEFEDESDAVGLLYLPDGGAETILLDDEESSA